MVCRRQCRSWPSHSAIAILTTAVGLVGSPRVGPAQPPLPTGDPAAPTGTTSLPLYRPPALALVQPPPGGSVPQDRPIVVFRFTPGESGDPIDARSFSLAVNTENRSALFQVAAGEAWGRLAPPAGRDVPPIAAGEHRVAARICSVRGACAEATAMVTVVASPASTPEKPSIDRKRTLIDLLLLAARKLINP